jgi:hypothetical protein
VTAAETAPDADEVERLRAALAVATRSLEAATTGERLTTCDELARLSREVATLRAAYASDLAGLRAEVRRADGERAAWRAEAARLTAERDAALADAAALRAAAGEYLAAWDERSAAQEAYMTAQQEPTSEMIRAGDRAFARVVVARNALRAAIGGAS